MERPQNWIESINEPDNVSELDDLRSWAQRGRPFGSEDWMMNIAPWARSDNAFARSPCMARELQVLKSRLSFFALPLEREHAVSERAKFLGRDQANTSMMLLRASARERDQL